MANPFVALHENRPVTKSTSTFSYSFSIGGDSPVEQEQELFALDQLSEVQQPDGAILARNPRTGKEMVLPLEVLNAMSYCSDFRSMDEHVAMLMDGNDPGAGKAHAIRKVVQSVHAGGLTISAKEICDRLAPDKAASPIQQKPVLVVITWERPQALERLLGSILANCDLKNIDCCFVVDDSRSGENRLKNRQVTQAIARQASISIHYHGSDESRDLMDGLIKRLPQYEEEIRFLIDREKWKDQWTAGIARNYSHLLSVGKPVIVIDDDALCEVYETPFREQGIEFSRRQREAAFYANDDEWRAEPAAENRDPIARHMQCLGLTVPQALRVLGMDKLEQAALRHAQPTFARRLNQHSRVLVTECGSMGDPGTGGIQWLATMSADSRDRLMQHEGRLQQALEQRHCWLGRTHPVFEPNANISQVTGFDNRGFLPPYFPIIRGQDRLFGVTTSFIFPDSVTLDFPWAVPHLPIPARTWSEQQNDFSVSKRFPGWITSQVVSRKDQCTSEAPQSRLEFLARSFKELAESTDDVLLGLYADDWNESRDKRLEDLQQNIRESAAQPKAWQDYLQNAFQQVQSSSLGEPRIPELSGMVGDLCGSALVSFWREAWLNFGQSLLAWPDIRQAAQDIIEENFGA